MKALDEDRVVGPEEKKFWDWFHANGLVDVKPFWGDLSGITPENLHEHLEEIYAELNHMVTAPRVPMSEDMF